MRRIIARIDSAAAPQEMLRSLPLDPPPRRVGLFTGTSESCAGVGWLASYAPADDPRIVIVTFVKPGSGHLASTVAGRIYPYLYKPAAPQIAAPLVSSGE